VPSKLFVTRAVIESPTGPGHYLYKYRQKWGDQGPFRGYPHPDSFATSGETFMCRITIPSG